MKSVSFSHNRGESGQGLREYALILLLILVVVITILGILGPGISNVFSNIVEGIKERDVRVGLSVYPESPVMNLHAGDTFRAFDINTLSGCANVTLKVLSGPEMRVLTFQDVDFEIVCPDQPRSVYVLVDPEAPPGTYLYNLAVYRGDRDFHVAVPIIVIIK